MDFFIKTELRLLRTRLVIVDAWTSLVTLIIFTDIFFIFSRVAIQPSGVMASTVNTQVTARTSDKIMPMIGRNHIPAQQAFRLVQEDVSNVVFTPDSFRCPLWV